MNTILTLLFMGQWYSECVGMNSDPRVKDSLWPHTPLDLANIRRWSFMIRSFFGEQQGEFKLDIKSVAAFY
jgi:hypothetical protein